MSYAKVYSAQLYGTSSVVISVEINISPGLNSCSLVGMGDKAVQESIDRISSALTYLNYKSPRNLGARITGLLSPAEMQKTGTGFDLPLLVAFLHATRHLHLDKNNHCAYIGEVSLSGEVNPTQGVLNKVIALRNNGFKEVIVPFENAQTASHIKDIIVYGAKNIRDVILHINGKQKLLPSVSNEGESLPYVHTFENIKGNTLAKRAFEICAVGRHNILLFGPPGGGKTMLAKALPSILPKLTYEKSIETTSIHSIYNYTHDGLIIIPPFRDPHHTASYASIVGGGVIPQPGEITLAHNGVLFMDELPLFGKKVIDSLREPLESKTISISRARGRLFFKADFMLIGAMNPPDNLESKKMTLSGISKPIIDRFDMVIEVKGNTYHNQDEQTSEYTSAQIQTKVIEAQQFGMNLRKSNATNSTIPPKYIEECVYLSQNAQEVILKASEQLGLSIRGVHRLLRVSRSIADLDASYNIKEAHVYEAISLRNSL